MPIPDAPPPQGLPQPPFGATPAGSRPPAPKRLSTSAVARVGVLGLAAIALAVGSLSVEGWPTLAPLPRSELERALELDAPRFEAFLLARLPGPLPPAELATLSEAFGSTPHRATRAALLLAASRSAAASEALLARLETRAEAPERHADAGDVTAAAALARGPLAERCAERLLELADGPRPHPDLEVRTGCAIAALTLGRWEAIDFLLRVLRIDTPSASRQGPITQSTTTAWPRGRAGEALSRAAGVPFEDWSDRSLTEREANADRLEALLRAR